MSEKVWGELREVIQRIFSFLLFIWIMSEARQAFYVNSCLIWESNARMSSEDL